LYTGALHVEGVPDDPTICSCKGMSVHGNSSLRPLMESEVVYLGATESWAEGFIGAWPPPINPQIGLLHLYSI
jgi:hypothetical protein